MTVVRRPRVAEEFFWEGRWAVPSKSPSPLKGPSIIGAYLHVLELNESTLLLGIAAVPPGSSKIRTNDKKDVG
jgi:hypothetical protein